MRYIVRLVILLLFLILLILSYGCVQPETRDVSRAFQDPRVVSRLVDSGLTEEKAREVVRTVETGVVESLRESPQSSFDWWRLGEIALGMVGTFFGVNLWRNRTRRQGHNFPAMVSNRV